MQSKGIWVQYKMTKTFKKNKDGKVEFTVDELKKLLDEAYWEGYHDNDTWVYNTPGTGKTWWSSPYVWTSTTTSDITLNSSNDNNSHLINASDITSNTITMPHLTTDSISIKVD